MFEMTIVWTAYLWAGVIGIGLTSAIWAQPGPMANLLDVPYGAGALQQLDVYKPPQHAGRRTAVILIHGGGWISGDKHDYASVAQLITARDMVAVAINYHLANGSPDGFLAAQIDDAQTAVIWVRKHAADLGIDPNRICAWGNSAGGHLAAFLAVLRQPVEARVACAVDEFGPIDLPTYFRGRTPENMFGKVDPAMRERVLEKASPVTFVTKDTAPILIVQGTADTMVKPEHSEKLRDALQKAGVEVKYITYPGGHGFSGLSRSQYTALQEMELDFVHAIGRSSAQN